MTEQICHICSVEFKEDCDQWWRDTCDTCDRYVCRKHRTGRPEYDDGAVCDDCALSYEQVRCAICNAAYARQFQVDGWTECVSCKRQCCPQHMKRRKCTECGANDC